MNKPEIFIPSLMFGALVLIVAIIASYNLYTNAKNRELYAECLRVVERVTERSERSKTFVSTSALSCNLR